MQIIHGFRTDNIRGDIYGGLTAAVVALPLALAFGVASGAGPMAGIYGAIFVGFFAALFGGTPSQISGPTGPMTVVMALIVTKYAHEPAMAFTVVMIGGGLQVLFGALRLGRYIRLMPFPVISGFMSGIGCIIILLQIAPLLGQPVTSGPIPALKTIPHVLTNINWHAAAAGGLALGIVFLTPQRLGRLLPSPLIALLAGALLVWLVIPEAPVLGEIPTGLPDPQLPRLSLDALPDMLSSALILALLGSLDSLLTSLIADSITRTQHKSDRELIGQGIGNMAAGLFGGIPGAGATIRTVINVRTGGRTPVSGMLHAVVLLAVVLGLGPLASHIPHAVLAGILFKVGIDIIDWRYLARARRAPRAGVVLMLLVMGLTIFVDLIVAVGAGVVAASLLFVKRMSDLQLQNIHASETDFEAVPLNPEEMEILERHRGRILHVRLSGALSFGGAKDLTQRLTDVHACRAMIIEMADVVFMDTSAALALEEIIQDLQDENVAVVLVGINDHIRKDLDGLKVLDRMPPGRIFEDRLEAFRCVAEIARAWPPET